MAFEDSLDAKRVLGVLGKRLGWYGLTLHLALRLELLAYKDDSMTSPATSPTPDQTESSETLREACERRGLALRASNCPSMSPPFGAQKQNIGVS